MVATMVRSALMKSLQWIVSGIAFAIALYLAAALAGSLIPANGGWQEPREGVTIHVVSNGYHTGIVLPASAAGIDLSLTFRPTDLPEPDAAGEWLLIGWGDRDFYRNTPHWSDVSPKTVVVALIGSDASLIHVDHLARIGEVADPRPVVLTRAQYTKLVAGIFAALERGPDGHPCRTRLWRARRFLHRARPLQRA
jgi:uncharacterized protein (TIGR02117 family)